MSKKKSSPVAEAVTSIVWEGANLTNLTAASWALKAMESSMDVSVSYSIRTIPFEKPTATTRPLLSSDLRRMSRTKALPVNYF